MGVYFVNFSFYELNLVKTALKNEDIFQQKHEKLYFCEHLLCYGYYMNEFPGASKLVSI